MTEGEWNVCASVPRALDALRAAGKADDRRLRLFAAAWCRAAWESLTAERLRRAVEVAERYADGLATDQELHRARSGACEAAAKNALGPGRRLGLINRAGPSEAERVRALACDSTCPPTPFYLIQSRWRYLSEDLNVTGAELLREIFGNPFRARPPLEPSLLAWEGGTIRRLAEEAYERRILPAGTLDPQCLGVLADALEDSGGDAELVGHLRKAAPHCRGCWAVDLILAKA